MQFDTVRNEVGLNRFVMTPTKWIKQMNAIGIVSKSGRYGGTYAHSDIAMERRKSNSQREYARCCNVKAVAVARKFGKLQCSVN